jgi:nucleotide-binding universal stress UspA family protein
MFHRILAPLDGSVLAEKSMPYVEAIAQKFDAEVVMCWVVQLRTYAMSDFQPIDYGLATLLDTTMEKERATKYLERLQGKMRERQIRASYHIVESYSIADAIVNIAVQEKADLIIKTTYARLGPSRWLQGNVAAAVLQRAPCPLFLVRVSGEEAQDQLLDTAQSSIGFSDV